MLHALCSWEAQLCDVMTFSETATSARGSATPTPSLLSSYPYVEAGWSVGFILDTGWVFLILLPLLSFHHLHPLKLVGLLVSSSDTGWVLLILLPPSGCPSPLLSLRPSPFLVRPTALFDASLALKILHFGKHFGNPILDLNSTPSASALFGSHNHNNDHTSVTRYPCFGPYHSDHYTSISHLILCIILTILLQARSP